MSWLNAKRRTAGTFLLYFCAPWKVATEIAVSILLLTATSARSQPVPGSLDVHWNEGASDCKATPQAPLQVHAYEPQTFMLRQSPCADFEANFLYLLIGSDKKIEKICFKVCAWTLAQHERLRLVSMNLKGRLWSCLAI